MLKLLKKEKGFTLIELMVVVLIIAILVAIAVPVFNVARSSAQRRTCQANLRTMDGAIQTYNADQDDWPTSTGDLSPEYVKEIPTCPSGDIDGAGLDENYQFHAAVGTTSPYVTCPNDDEGDVSDHDYP